MMVVFFEGWNLYSGVVICKIDSEKNEINGEMSDIYTDERWGTLAT